MGLTHHNEQMTRYARVTYGQALCSLQKALYDPVQVATSETLCAASLLCLYEVGIVLVIFFLRIVRLMGG